MPTRPRKVPAPGQRDLALGILDSPSLPDKIPASVHTLFVGFGPGRESALSGHYYAGRGNYMWKLLHESAIWPRPLTAEDDDALVRAGFGFTDVIKRPTDGTIIATPAERRQARARLETVVAHHRPKLVVFVGLESIRTFLRKPNVPLAYGLQEFDIAGGAVFLVPSTSGASIASTDWWQKLQMFDKLHQTIQELGIAYSP